MSLPSSLTPLFSTGAGGAAGYQIERSLRFNPVDTPYLQRVFSGNGSNMKIRTFSCWVKRSGLGANKEIFSSSNTRLTFDGDTLYAEVAGALLQTTQVFRDVSAWYHILFAWDTTQATSSNRSKLYVNGTQITTFSTTNYPTQNADTNFATTTGNSIIGQYQNIGGYVLDGYLAETYFIDGQALTPSSFTEVSATTGQLVPIAYTGGSYGTNGFYLQFADNSTAAALGTDTSGNNNDWTPNNFSVGGVVSHVTGGLSYRDSSSTNQTWDASSTSSSTSNAIGPDRRWWVDLGSSKSFNRITFNVVASGQSADSSANFITNFSTTSNSSGSNICGGGCAVTSASKPSGAIPGTITVTFAGFTSQTGRYIAITNGDGTRGGTYTYSNLQIYDDQSKDNDSLVDTPTSIPATNTGVGGEIRGNYCTWNPLKNPGGSTTFSNGNLDVSYGPSGTFPVPMGSLGVSSGKWYWEITIGSGTYITVGIGDKDCGPSASGTLGVTANGWAYDWQGNKYNNNSSASYGASFTNGDVIGIALDCGAGTLIFYKNGSSQGTAYTGLTNGPYFPAVGNAGGTTNVIANFGQRAFAYTAPTNYQPLVDTLLTAPLVAKPNTLMDVALWTANGSSQSITGLGFQPDLVWAKSRNTGATPHLLVDSVRGVNQVLSSHSTDSEQDYSTIGGCISAFNSDGFATGGNSDIATNNRTFVGWAWDAGEGSAVSNPDGSITSQVRANVSAGFSIVTYTGNGTGGATFGHGLGVAPEMLIFKTRGVADDWRVYHKQLDASAPANYYLILQSTNAKSGNQGTSFMNSTAPSSTLVTLGTDSAINGTGRTMVCYAFAPVVGYSSFGSYVGNGSSDGPMVWTGFRPRWVLIKDTSNGTNRHWIIIDSTRSFSNESASESVLFADNASSESPANDDFGQFASKNALDLLSNGFKVRESNTAAYTQANLSSNTYIYAAFAERPFQYSRAR